MPAFKNITNGIIYLPRENGLLPDLEINPGSRFNGSYEFYNRYVVNKLIARDADVNHAFIQPAVVTAGPDALTVALDYYFNPINLIVANSAEETLYGTPITAGSSYFCFGKITWREGSALYSATYSLDSLGTFLLSAIDPAGSTSEPTALVPGINKLVFSLNGAAMKKPIVTVNYNTNGAGCRVLHQFNPLLDRPNLMYIRTYNDNADTLPTTEKIFYIGAKAGDLGKIIMRTVVNNTQVTSEIESLYLVQESDLT